MERFGFIFLVAGLGFFILAFVVSAFLPTLGVQGLDVKSVEDLAANPPVSFIELKEDYPRAFRAAFYPESEAEVLGRLQSEHGEVFDAVFSRTEEEGLAVIHDRYPQVWESVFGNVDVEGALFDFEFDPESYLDQIREADSAAFSSAFESSVESIAEWSEFDYSVALTKLRQELGDEAYVSIFETVDDSTALADALRTGHRIYIGEGCWHCHSQQIRPWGRDEARYGQISYPEEYHNELNYPPIWGTRRVGPDLIRRGEKNSNDWHVAHFYDPRSVVPNTVMPGFPWFYENDGMTPNRKGLSIIAYVQWQGTWQGTQLETIHTIGSIERSYEAVSLDQPDEAPPDAGGEG